MNKDDTTDTCVMGDSEVGAAMTESLTEIVVRLRDSGLGKLPGRTDPAVRSTAEAFVGHLAEHLDEADALLPAVLDMAPATAAEIEVIRSDHRLLRGVAHDLFVGIVSGQPSKACDTARSFLAKLFAHADREKALMRRLTFLLDERDLRLLAGMCPSRRESTTDIGGESG